jgi:hypothetical protein
MEHRVRERKKENGLLTSESNREKHHVYREEAKAEWVMQSQEEKDYWESQAQSKAARQPQIRDDIIENKRANPSKSSEQLAVDTDSWASAAAIHSWFKKQGASMMCWKGSSDLNGHLQAPAIIGASPKL